MKVKMKFDMDKLKAFGIEHGEKFGLALAVLILGWFIVKAVSREHLPDNLAASKIDDRSNTADRTVKATHSPPAEQDVKVPDFVSMVNKEASVPKISYDNPLVIPAFDDPIKRVDPTLFPVEELRVAPFRGGIVVSALAGNRLPAGNVVVPPAGGLLPGKAATPVRPGVRGPAAARPPAAGPAANLLLPGNAAAAGPAEKPFPAGFEQPGPAGSGAAEGVHGIVITGLIPDLAQREEYARRFKNARRGVSAEGAGNGGSPRDRVNAGIDVPQYVWSKLERTDTTDGAVKLLDFGDTEQIVRDVHQEPDAKAQVKELRISPAERNRLEAERARWSGLVAEVADPAYVSFPWFTWGLPPVLLRDWGAEAAHPPKVPLAVAAAAAGPGVVDKPGTDAAQPDTGFENATGSGAGPARGVPGRGPGRRYPPTMTRPDVGGQNPQAVAEEIPYKLFRFIDLNVEPGHVYQYRVQMLLRNPNFGLEAQVLLKPETASVAYRETPWSEKSPTIAIPPDTRLLGGAIERPKHQEPKAKVSIFMFDKDQAIELLKEFDTELGALVGTEVEDEHGKPAVPEAVAKDVADPVKRVIRDITGEFRSKSVLLDMRGNDEKLPGAGNITDPAEMLLIDNIEDPEHAKLVVVNQAKDLPIIEGWNKTHVAPAAPAANALVPEPAKGAIPKSGGLIPGAPVTPKPGPARRPGAR